MLLGKKASLVAQTVNCLPTMWETRVRSLGREDTLEKAMATHSSILAWKIPWTEELGWLLSMGSQRVGHDLATSLYLKWITNKDLLYSTWNSAQCYVAAWIGGEFGGEWIHIYVCLSLFTVYLKLSQYC